MRTPIELMHSVAPRVRVFVFDNVPFDGAHLMDTLLKLVFQ